MPLDPSTYVFTFKSGPTRNMESRDRILKRGLRQEWPTKLGPYARNPQSSKRSLLVRVLAKGISIKGGVCKHTNKRTQTQTTADFRLSEKQTNADKREQTQTNANKRKIKELHPFFLRAPFCGSPSWVLPLLQRPTCTSSGGKLGRLRALLRNVEIERSSALDITYFERDFFKQDSAQVLVLCGSSWLCTAVHIKIT